MSFLRSFQNKCSIEEYHKLISLSIVLCTNNGTQGCKLSFIVNRKRKDFEVV
nr:MAG TPA: hypothetical protein [Caudoviricetes sp.]